MDTTVRRLLDHVADIYVSFKGIAAVLDEWNAQPRSGRIVLGMETAMSQPPTNEIPADDVPAVVKWFDRLGTEIQHDKTDTTWSAEDQTGAPSTAVTVNPDLDTDSDDETATVVFSQSSGEFKVVATTAGDSGPIRAESILYTITPGAPAVGQITLSPT